MEKEFFCELSPDTKLRYAMKCLENNPDAVFWSDETGAIAYVNSAACKELGYSKEELLKMNIAEIDLNFKTRAINGLDDFIKSAASGKVVRMQTIHIRKDGRHIPMDISIGELDSGKISLGFSFARDMTEQTLAQQELKVAYEAVEQKNRELSQLYNEIKTREEQLQFLAYHDQLTNLSNRIRLMETLNRDTHSNRTDVHPFALLFIDLDNFKNINDGLGHSVGDLVLIEVGKRLQENVRDMDGVYRFGGDEFVVLMQDYRTQRELHTFAHRIKDCLLAPFHIELASLYLTCSIGVSIFPKDANAAETLLMYADSAMYRAKAAGKNHVYFFNSEMRRDVCSKIELQNKLRFALERHEFHLEYQPQYDMKTWQIRGIEALIRWENPCLGAVGPTQFVPPAEEMGIIVPIGKWVLTQACLAARRLEDSLDFSGIVSVNLAGGQLQSTNFVQDVRDALETSGLPPYRLELEITESIFISAFEPAVMKLLELKALGVRICLDDFGTGYSSLGYLMQLPLNTLKIDKTFLQQIAFGSTQKHILGSILALVHDLGFETIVEGVETAEQLEYLKTTKSNYLQGYLFSQPIREEQLRLLFAEEPQTYADGT